MSQSADTATAPRSAPSSPPAGSGQSLEDLVKATVRVIYANEIAPGLEDEILQRVAAGEQDAVAKAIRAVGERLTQ